MFTDISDHLPILCINLEQSAKSSKHSYFTFRDKNKVNISNFHDQLRNTDWTNLKGYNNPSDAYMKRFWIDILVFIPRAFHYEK